MEKAPSCDTTTTDDGDDDTLPPIRNLANGMNLVFKRVSDAIVTSMWEGPHSSLDNSPPRSICHNNCPPILYIIDLWANR